MIIKEELLTDKYKNSMVLSNTKGSVLKRLDFDEMEDVSYLFYAMDFDMFPKTLNKNVAASYFNLGNGLIKRTTKVEISMYNIASGFLFGQSGGNNNYGPFVGGNSLSFATKVYTVPKGDMLLIIDPNEQTIKINDTIYNNVDFSKLSETEYAFCIFSTSSGASYPNGNYQNCAVNAKFYYMKTWDGEGNLLHHYVPYINGNVPVIYDLVTKQITYSSLNLFGSTAIFE